MALVVLDDFEDSDLSDWTFETGPNGNENDVELDSSVSFNNSTSLHLLDQTQDTATEIYKTIGSQTSSNEVIVPFRYNSSNDNNFEIRVIADSTSDTVATRVRIYNQEVHHGSGTGDFLSGLIASISQNTWYQMRFYNIDYANNQTDMEVLDSGGSSLGTATGVSFTDNASGFRGVEITNSLGNGGDPDDVWVDYIQYEGQNVVTTGSATNVGLDSATLNGTLNSLEGNSSVDVYFDYKKASDSSFTSTSTQTLSSTGSFSESISNLSSATEYEYKAVATDGSTTWEGGLQTFTTLSDKDQYVGYFQSASSNGTQTVTDIPFEPDVVQLIATNTNAAFDTQNTYNGGSFGFSHGFSDVVNNNHLALCSASGSSSTNGQASESSNSYSVNMLITPSDGDAINGRIQGYVTSTGTGQFTMQWDSTSESQYIVYRAFRFDADEDFEVGSFNNPGSTGTQSITTGFEPNFLMVKQTPRLENMTQTIQDGNNNGFMHGWACRNSDDTTSQSVQSVSMNSNNINHHVYGAFDDRVIHTLWDTATANVSSIDGRVSANLDSWDVDGFTLNYTTVNPHEGTNHAAIYLAVKSNKQPEVGMGLTPTGTSTQTKLTNSRFEDVFTAMTPTNPGTNQDGSSGDNQGENTHGWVFGGRNHTGGQLSMGYSSNSNSVNDHRSMSSATDVLKQPHTDADGNLYGVHEADISNIDSDSFDLNWTDVVTATDGTAFDQTAYTYWTLGTRAVFEVGLSENIGAADSSFVETTFARFLNEGAVVNDSSSSEGDFSRSVSDSAAVTDSTASEGVFSRSVSDSATVADLTFREVGKKISQTMAISEQFSVDKTRVVELVETMAVSEALSKKSILSFQESISFSDAFETNFIPVIGSNETDGVFNTGTFDNATFNNITRSESPAVSGDVERVGDLSRSASETVDLTDSDIKQFSKILNEGLETQDSTEKVADLFRTFTEAVVLDDVVVDSLVFRELLEEAVQVNDVEDTGVSKSFEETLPVNDDAEKQVIKHLDEVLAINADERKRVETLLSENVTVNDVTELLTVVKLFEAAGLNDNVDVTADLFRSLAETIGLREGDVQEVELVLAETAALNDVSGSESSLFRDFAESVALSDEGTKTIFKALLELVAVTDNRSTGFLKNVVQSLEVSDNISKKFRTALQEEITFASEISKTVGIVNTESVSTEDKVETVAELFRDIAAVLDLNDADVRDIELILSETVSPRDFDRKSLSKNIASQLVVSEDFEKQFDKVVKEAVGLSEKVETKADLFRTVNQTVLVTDNLSKQLESSLGESFSLTAETVKTVGKVLEDSVSFSDKVTSFEQADALATQVRIDKLQKAVTNITATRKVVAELEKDTVSDADLDKF